MHIGCQDTIVKINPATNTVETDLYCKPTDSHNYLLYNSAHPKKCKESIPYSQFLRIRRICTNITDYDRHIVMLSKHFLRRGYPLILLESAAITARRLDRTVLLAKKKNPEKDSDDVILVTTFEPSQDLLRNITKENWDYLGKSHMTTFIHEKKIMVGYRRPKNLRDLLVKADCSLPKKTVTTNPVDNTTRNLFLLGRDPAVDPTETAKKKQSSMNDFVYKIQTQGNTLASSSSVGNLMERPARIPTRSASLTQVVKNNLLKNKCMATKSCTYCPLLNRSGSIICHVTGKKFCTKKNITFRSSNLVYCITCKKCDKQYVGQTMRTIMERFQGHCGKITAYRKRRREDPILSRQLDKDGVGNHFSADNHNGIKDLIISVLAFITITPRSEAALKHRLTVEKEWIHRLRCPAPEGLNILD